MGRKSRDRRNCRRKLRHSHYLSALLHARKLRQDENLTIYPCPFCQYLHVGHARMMSKRLTAPEKKKARLRRKIAQVQQQLAQLHRNLKQLLDDETKPLAQNHPNGPPGA